MAIRDLNRSRKVYSYFRARPVSAPEVTSSDMSDLTLTSTKTSNYNAVIGDLVAYDPTGTGGISIRLPSAVGQKDKRVAFKNVSDDTTAVIIDANGSETIDGAFTLILNEPRLSGFLRSDDTNWIVEDIWYVSTPAVAAAYWSSTQNGSIFTTGSALFRGTLSSVLYDSPRDVRADLNFFVSGTVGSPLGSGNTSHAGFGGDVIVSGTLTTETGLSGSLTQLSDGTSYLIAGTNVTITSASNGAITLDAMVPSSPTFFESSLSSSLFTTGSVAFKGDEILSSSFQKGTDVFFYVSGSTGAFPQKSLFGGDVVVSGSLESKAGLSGSLTRLVDGTSYLVAGTNVTITSASNGSVTIDSSAGGGGGSFEGSFTNANLTASVLTVNHGLLSKYVNVSVFNNSDTLIIPDDVTASAAGTSTVDLTSFAPIPGTWNVLVVASSGIAPSTGTLAIPALFTVPAALTTTTTDSSGYARIGIINFDPTAYKSSEVGLTRTITFKSYMTVQSAGGAGLESHLKLYNIDSNVDVFELSSSALPSDVPSLARKSSSALVSGVDLTAGLATYEVLLKKVSGSLPDVVNCHLSQFEVAYT